MRIEAHRLGVDLKGRPVLRGVDFSAQPAEVTAIIGPNGAGKSTLLRALAGLLTPAAGTVLADARPLGDWDRQTLARSLAYLPQDRVVHWALTARTVVALGRLPHQPPGAGESDPTRAPSRPRSRDGRYPSRSTPGHRNVRRRAGTRAGRAGARAGAVRPARRRACRRPRPGAPAGALRAFRQSATAGRTVIVALHDLSLAARFCHSIVLMHEGRVVAAGTPQDVLTVEHLAAVYRIDARVATLDGVPVVLPRALLP